METIDNIPVSKIQRATKMLQTGAKVGVNYLKYERQPRVAAFHLCQPHFFWIVQFNAHAQSR